MTVSVLLGQTMLGPDIVSGVTQEQGFFEFPIPATGTNQGAQGTITIIIEDAVGRELGRFPHITDLSQETKSVQDLKLNKADATGYLVTLGTGEVRTGGNGAGWGLSDGRVRFLMDRDAFKFAADLFSQVRDSLLMSELFFTVPDVFSTDATHETPRLIFDFHAPPPTADHLRAAGVGDARPERLLLQAADRDVDVRILLHAFKIPLFIKILAGLLLFPFAGTDGVALATHELLGTDFTDTDEVKRYFSAAGRPKVRVRPFEQPIFSAGVMHAKLLVADSSTALSIGSPFEQNYVDTHDHLIDEPIRGDTDGFPMHDAGFVVEGPVTRDVYETLRLLWHTISADDTPDPWPSIPPESHHGPGVPRLEPEAEGSIQIVRTLSEGRFKNFPGSQNVPREGEKGILEAYLRAINNATDFIYLENQYFTNDAIGHALVEAMKRNRKLQTIMLVNIQPDVPFYPFKQRRLIHRIREDIGKDHAKRFGVFTRWTHQVGQPRPRLLPVYVHAKLGLVDNSWATVGSANLDGLSLDSLLLNPFVEQRAIELNAVFLNNVDDQPTSDAVDILRRKLWAEHLGFETGPGEPDATAAPLDLKSRPPGDGNNGGGWLKLWTNRAEATRQQLTNAPNQPLTGRARVLPWPTPNTTYKTTRKHLEALGIHSFAVVPLKSTRAFLFKNGDWKPNSKAEMDYD